MTFSKSAPLPRHLYVFVDSTFITKDPAQSWLPAVWFGLTSTPSRMWGCTVMLECGAVYRGIPPHALAFCKEAVKEWDEEDAQRWDCYGLQFSMLEYTYLRGLGCIARVGDSEDLHGEYLFTAVPMEDGFSRHPGQSKEFMFIELDNGRLTIQPTDKVLFKDKSFGGEPSWPKNLKRMDREWSCEE
jgi:hypothetical protein